MQWTVLLCIGNPQKTITDNAIQCILVYLNPFGQLVDKWLSEKVRITENHTDILYVLIYSWYMVYTQEYLYVLLSFGLKRAVSR